MEGTVPSVRPESPRGPAAFMGLDTVELILAFEKEFEIEIENSQAVTLRTPGQAIEWIALELETLGRPLPKEVIAFAVKTITLRLSGVAERFYREDARFVDDFCMD